MTTTWTAPTAPPRTPRRRWPLWVKVLVTFVVVVVTGMALFVGAVVVSLSGGLDDVLDVSNPSKDSRSVVKARGKAATRLDPLHVAVTSGLGASDTRVRVSRDECQIGEHNWKIDDPYDLDCVLARGSVYVVPLNTDHDALVADVERALEQQRASWTPQDSYGHPNDRRWTRGGNPEAGAATQEVTITVIGANDGVQSYELRGGYDDNGNPEGITRDGEPYGVEALRNEHPGSLVVVTTSERYFYA